MAERSSKMVVLIGVFRLTKAAVLIAVGLGALFGLKWPLIAALASTADTSGFFWARSIIERAIQGISSLDAHHIHEIGIASLAYAAVFIVEGTGLVLRKRWAEWLTIVVTSSFVLFEAYELVHKPGVGKVVALVVNVAIVVYLIVRVRQKQGVGGVAKKALRSRRSSAGGAMPDAKLAKAGVLLSLDGLPSTAKRARVTSDNDGKPVVFVELNGIEPSASSMPFRDEVNNNK